MIDIVALITSIVTSFGLGAAPGAPAAAKPATVKTAPAAPTNANAIVDQVQKFYANIQQVTAQFQQSVTNNTFGTAKTSGGNVYIKKPGKMRWDYNEKKNNQVKTKKNFISDGTTLYVVEHDNQQVMQRNLQQDLMPVAVTFLYGKGDLKTEFDAELDQSGKYGAKGDLVLKLKPKQSSAQYKNLFLVVNPTDYHVKQSIIIDSSDNINHFQFFAPDFAKPVQDSWFVFNASSVPTYRVVTANSGGMAPPAQKAPVPPVPPVPPKK